MAADGEGVLWCGSSSAKADEETATDGKLQDPMELLDECWFYRNLLLCPRTGRVNPSPAKPPLTAAPMTSGADDCSLDSVWSSVQQQRQREGKVDCSGPRALPRSSRVASGALLRSPSMPSPRGKGSSDRRIDEEESASDIEEDDIVAMVKRSLMEDHRMRSAMTGRRTMLLKAPSMPAPRPAYSAIEEDASNKQSISRLRHSCSTLENHILHHYRSPTRTTRAAAATARPRPTRDHPKVAVDDGGGHANGCTINEEASSRRTLLQGKKWNSFADLESAEVQGFKDLGFVFDQEELNSRLLKVIPGLRGGGSPSTPEATRRTRLSDAWFVQRSAPPVVLNRASRSSVVDMKEQLRFWARAVACNVRHEC